MQPAPFINLRGAPAHGVNYTEDYPVFLAVRVFVGILEENLLQGLKCGRCTFNDLPAILSRSPTPGPDLETEIIIVRINRTRQPGHYPATGYQTPGAVIAELQDSVFRALNRINAPWLGRKPIVEIFQLCFVFQAF